MYHWLSVLTNRYFYTSQTALGFSFSHHKGQHKPWQAGKHTDTVALMLETGQGHEKTLGSIHIH